MKAKKVEKVITILQGRIGHPLKRHLTENPTTLKEGYKGALSFEICSSTLKY